MPSACLKECSIWYAVCAMRCSVCQHVACMKLWTKTDHKVFDFSIRSAPVFHPGLVGHLGAVRGRLLLCNRGLSACCMHIGASSLQQTHELSKRHH